MTELARLVMAGGGTAGHVAPLLATADAVRRRYPEAVVRVLGTAEGLEARLVPERGYPLDVIPKVAFPRRPGGAALRFPLTFRTAVARAGAVLDEVRPQAVVGFGGYVSTPAYLAAHRRGIPIVVHEANSPAGLANKVGARYAAAVATVLASTELKGARRIGLPLRREITTLDRAALRDEALAHFGFSGVRPVVLVSGGSLGAKRLNDAFQEAHEALAHAGVDVLHVTGRGKVFEAEPVAGAVHTVVEYCDRMDLAFAAADLVVARAGAGMVAETSALGLPTIFVPLPIGNGEQRRNAADVVTAGGGLLVDDAQVTGSWVLHEVVPLALDRERLAAMGEAAARVGVRDADERLVDMIEEVAADA